MPTTPPAAATRRSDFATKLLSATAIAACLGLIAYKFFLTRQLNVNWDEFFYLSFVHAAARNELTLLLNGAYVHLFQWLPALPLDEMDQIVVARAVMVAGLALTAFLTWRLSSVSATGFPALIAPFVYLAAVPVVVHGGSFRSDSLLAPLTMAALLLLAAPPRSTRRDIWAGALLGAAFVVTIKVALFAPLVAGLLAFRRPASLPHGGSAMTTLVRSAAHVSIAALVTAAALLFLHWLALGSAPVESAGTFAARTASKTLLDVPWFPRVGFLRQYVIWQPLPWLLILLGTAAALFKRRFDLASLALALLPIAVYRNAFSYFYVVMLAPASVLAAFALQTARDLVVSKAREGIAVILLGVIWVGLLYQGLANVGQLRFDDQLNQRMLVSAVHQVFPEPVSYVDRCGMISSFRKVNFFMSTWGMENYRARNQPFMPQAIREYQPAFVVVNTHYLNPNRPVRNGLLAEDYELIARFYPKYWGPLRVAGAAVRLTGPDSVRVLTPFPSSYRLETSEPVRVDGVLRNPGDVIDVPADGVLIGAASGQAGVTDIRVRLVLAIAQPPPLEQLPGVPLFAGL